jgi:hypothetical protein
LKILGLWCKFDFKKIKWERLVNISIITRLEKGKTKSNIKNPMRDPYPIELE